MCFKRPLSQSLLRLWMLTFGALALSGCALNTNKETLDAIQTLDTGLQQRLENLEQQNQKQSQQLTKLQSQLTSNNQAIDELKANQNRLITLVEAKKKADPQSLTASPPQQANTQSKVILGSKEWVWLDAAQANFKARVDSGATTSSIHAPSPVFFERNGEEWVRFELLTGDNEETEPKTIEAPIVRWVRIIQASAEEAERRPVIEAWIQVGGLREKAEFTLADRSNMTFQILLGREFFKDVALIDVGKAYIHPKQSPQSLTDGTPSE